MIKAYHCSTTTMILVRNILRVIEISFHMLQVASPLIEITLRAYTDGKNDKKSVTISLRGFECCPNCLRIFVELIEMDSVHSNLSYTEILIII